MAAAATVLLAERAGLAESAQHASAAVTPGPRSEDIAPADWDEVRARYANLIRVYGERLSHEEQQRLVHILSTNVRMLTSIRSFFVQNGDPSACTLRLVEAQPHDGQSKA
jgi:hypothetical protein